MEKKEPKITLALSSSEIIALCYVLKMGRLLDVVHLKVNAAEAKKQLEIVRGVLKSLGKKLAKKGVEQDTIDVLVNL